MLPFATSLKPSSGQHLRPPEANRVSNYFFAGKLSEDKGVGDRLNAISILRTDGVVLTMSFAGVGNVSEWEARAERLGIGEQVKFLGLIPIKQVRAEMHNHDFVIVPLRHSYSEGLPNTIHEGLAARSALVISDHPAFAGQLKSDIECLVYPATNATALTSCIKRTASDRGLCQRMSANAAFTHDQLYVSME